MLTLPFPPPSLTQLRVPGPSYQAFVAITLNFLASPPTPPSVKPQFLPAVLEKLRAAVEELVSGLRGLFLFMTPNLTCALDTSSPSSHGFLGEPCPACPHTHVPSLPHPSWRQQSIRGKLLH